MFIINDKSKTVKNEIQGHLIGAINGPLIHHDTPETNEYVYIYISKKLVIAFIACYRDNDVVCCA